MNKKVRKTISIERQKKLDKALFDGGFYKDDGRWNSIIMFPNDPHVYRNRVETLIFKDNSIFVKRDMSRNKYFVPGGSVERYIPNIDQAANECNQEALINVKNVESTGITYKDYLTVRHSEIKSDVTWDGLFTEVYVAQYAGKYTEKVEDRDKSPYILSGQFIPIEECMKFFKKPHKEALNWYRLFH